MIGKIINTFIESLGRLIISAMAITSANILVEDFAMIGISIICILWIIKGFKDELSKQGVVEK